MSANNQYYAKKIDDKYYGWETNAEETMADDGKRVLEMKDALCADTIEELEELLDDKWNYAEYGIITSPYLVKDGTPIVVEGET